MAMRKVFYGSEGIMLKHILRMYDKESLLNYARDLEIKRTSGLSEYHLCTDLPLDLKNALPDPEEIRSRIEMKK